MGPDCNLSHTFLVSEDGTPCGIVQLGSETAVSAVAFLRTWFEMISLWICPAMVAKLVSALVFWPRAADWSAFYGNGSRPDLHTIAVLRTHTRRQIRWEVADTLCVISLGL